MAARKKYGITYWGQEWLNAFVGISDANRLPRGRTYANTGRARNIQIDGNKITADVQGSRRTPYKVVIEIPLFTQKETEQILELVQENPMYLSQLLNRELPINLNAACKKKGISIFPQSWREFEASCSCPDWAMPCKHLASVIYLVANEIDKNPFLVFELHGFELGKELEKLNVGVKEQEQIPIKKVQELYQTEKTKKGSKWSFEPELLEQLDFTQIPESKLSLLTILGDHPVFFPDKDFKVVLGEIYDKISKNVSRKLKVAQTYEEDSFYENIDDLKIIVNEELSLERVEIIQNEEVVEVIVEIDLFIEWLNKIPFGRLEYCIPKLQALFFTERLAMKLAQNSAMIPQLIELEPETFKIRWLPALLNENVRTIFELIEKLTPTDLLYFEVTTGKRKKTSKEFSASSEEKSLGILSLFLSKIVSTYNGESGQFHYPIEVLFFAGHIRMFNQFEDREFPNAIQLWLNRFYLAEKKYTPIIKVTEKKDETFQVEIELEKKSKKAGVPSSMKDLFKKKSFQDDRLDILRDLAMLSNYFPEIEKVVSSKGKEKLNFDPDAFVQVLFKVLPIIRLFGIKVMLPKALQKIIRPSLSMALSSEGEGQIMNSSILSLAEILKFKWQVALGNLMVPEEEFLKMVKTMSGIVKLNDQYVYFDEKEIAKLLDKLENPPQVNGRELLYVALSEDYKGSKVFLDKKAQKLIQNWLSADKVKVPKTLLAKLRPYQRRGYDWMYKNSRLGFGSLIADDMGLGKTLQVIATILKLKEDGQLTDKKGLIVVPTTLLTNWQKEIEKFAPSLTTTIYHGSKRKLAPAEYDLTITTYGIARSDAAKLKKHPWLLLVIDEAQNIKNPATAQTKAMKKIPADVRIAMSGTPVENRLSEYWSIFDFANKGLLGSLTNFNNEFAKPIQWDQDQRALYKFRKVTAPFIMRRLKSDKNIIQDLPDKIESNQYCKLTPEQASLYESVVQTNMKAVEENEGINRKGLILKLITALKQVCNHPTQFLKKGERIPGLSGKSIVLFDLMEKILSQGEKTLIFTQYREMGDMLAQMFETEMQQTVPFLHGGVSRKKRDGMVEDFQTNHSSKILLLSLKAAGTGLNLTAATNVIHYDLWWNPAVEAQATDRAYRIGQKSNVMVHRFITEATFEEKIDKLIQKKKKLADMTVATGEKWIGNMSDKELKSLVKLEK